MTLQNRVLPGGEIVAVAARGTLTGNRGCLHDDRRRIVRRWTTKAWICCRLEWNGVRRQVMAPRRWTELFFLDEAVALAAGHRPCGYCRRDDYRRFRDIWAGVLGPALAPQMDAVLHRARLGPKAVARPGDLPDGAFVVAASGPALIWGGALHGFTPDGYVAPMLLPGQPLTVLTPAPMLAVLRRGYQPAIHPTAAG